MRKGSAERGWGDSVISFFSPLGTVLSRCCEAGRHDFPLRGHQRGK